MTNSSLIHWGRLGMKWGVRKSQRRAAADARLSDDHKAVAPLKKKKVSEMSNDELKKLTTRLSLEKQLKDLNSANVTAGNKFVNDVLVNAGKQVASKFVANSVEQGIPKLIEVIKNLKQ